jgi:hypothetical protein
MNPTHQKAAPQSPMHRFKARFTRVSLMARALQWAYHFVFDKDGSHENKGSEQAYACGAGVSRN